VPIPLDRSPSGNVIANVNYHLYFHSKFDPKFILFALTNSEDTCKCVNIFDFAQKLKNQVSSDKKGIDEPPFSLIKKTITDFS
jgi:hypothetical protein